MPIMASLNPTGFLLSLLSPTTLSMFLAFFGIGGLIFSHLLHLSGLLTLGPAIVSAIVCTSIMLRISQAIFSTMNITSSHELDDVVGLLAEVITPISGGRSGEITYVVNRKRVNSPARCQTPGRELKRGAQVVVMQIIDHLAFVEPEEELELPGDTITLDPPADKIRIEDEEKKQ